MTKRAYLDLCMQQSVAWLTKCAASPSHGMRPVHIALVRIALRRKTGVED